MSNKKNLVEKLQTILRESGGDIQRMPDTPESDHPVSYNFTNKTPTKHEFDDLPELHRSVTELERMRGASPARGGGVYNTPLRRTANIGATNFHGTP